jgi:hypothetical protein
MSPTLISLISGLVSGAITAVITYLATRSKAVLDVTIENDKELRKERLTAYQQLWPKLKPLARYAAEKPLTWQIVKDTSGEMRDWYFSNAGIFLSAHSRKPYFDLKAIMQDIIDDPKLQQHGDKDLGKDLIKPLLEQATLLRASLSDDVGTRRKPFVS